MAADPYKPDYDYVAYIDESGDQGLQKVKPLDPKGSSEWLVVSAVLIRKENEHAATGWMYDIRKGLKSSQVSTIHFRKLKPEWRKQTVCQEIAKLPLRCFVVCSNKKNMAGYTNPYAEQIPSQDWFYCWLTRVLLEKLTLAALARQKGFVAFHSAAIGAERIEQAFRHRLTQTVGEKPRGLERHA